MRIYLLVTVSFAFLSLMACTSVRVNPVNSTVEIDHVCIQENPKVIVPGFLTVLEDGFERHGISTEVIGENIPSNCDFILKYVAFQTWDLASYLHRAELRIEHGGRRIGYAEYRLKGGGGLSLMKWQSVETKMNPVIDELLSNHRGMPAPQLRNY